MTTTTATDPSVHEAFIEAVMAPGASEIMLIDANNHTSILDRAHHTIDPASAYAVPIVSMSRFHTIALDFDVHEDLDATEADARFAAALLAAGGVLAVVCRSGPSSGYHVLARVEGGISAKQANRLATTLKHLGCSTLDPTSMSNNRAQHIRPPLAPHRGGGASLPVGDNDLALAVLQWGTSSENVERMITALPKRSSKLRRGADCVSDVPGQHREYASGSEAVQAVATRVANRGGSRFDFDRELRAEGAHDQVTETLTRRSSNPRECERWLDRSFSKAEKWVRSNPPKPGGHDEADIIRDWTTCLPLMGTELNDGERRVARFVIQQCIQHNRRLLGLSNRQAAMACNVSQRTAGRAMTAMTHRFHMLSLAGTNGAHRYRLEHPDHWQTRAGDSISPSRVSQGVGGRTESPVRADADGPVRMSDDTWTAPGFGERCWQLYMILREGSIKGRPTDAAEIAAEMGISASQVRRYFKRLVDVGLARRPSPGVWEAEIRDDADVASELGVDGALARRRRISKREQQLNNLRWVQAKMDTAGITGAHDWFEMNVDLLEGEIYADAQGVPAPVRAGRDGLASGLAAEVESWLADGALATVDTDCWTGRGEATYDYITAACRRPLRPHASTPTTRSTD